MRQPATVALRSRTQFRPQAVTRLRPSGWPPLTVSLLIVALVVPWTLWFGSLAVSVYRLALLILIVPCLVRWISGRAGRFRMTDLLLMLSCAWATLAIGVVHGPGGAIEPAGILFLETVGAYLVARCYVRTPDDFRATVRMLFVIVIIMLPAAVIEAVTGQKVMLELFRTVLPTNEGTITELRWGMSRVQGPFEHPILFGVFCSGTLALTHLVLGRGVVPAQRWAMSLTVAATASLSFSSSPLIALFAQFVLLSWNSVLNGVPSRWKILWVIGAVTYLVAELASNQSVPQLLTRFAFDQWTALYRLLIFEHGWASIMAHPLFGTGFNDWLHPSWMSSSIDMFWLVPAIRHGLPAAILFILAFLMATLSVGLRPCRSERLQTYKTAYLITMMGFFIAGWAVHFWMATYVLFMFLMGSGMWLLDAEPENPEELPAQLTSGLRSSRFPAGAASARRFRPPVRPLDRAR